MKAPKFCTNAAELMNDRAASRDTGEERSMAKTVAAFNALYGHNLSETEGWQFMSLLKKARGAQGAFRQDDYEDDVAYCALAGESACSDQPPVPIAVPPTQPMVASEHLYAPTISEYVERCGPRLIVNTGSPLSSIERQTFAHASNRKKFQELDPLGGPYPPNDTPYG